MGSGNFIYSFQTFCSCCRFLDSNCQESCKEPGKLVVQQHKWHPSHYGQPKGELIVLWLCSRRMPPAGFKGLLKCSSLNLMSFWQTFVVPDMYSFPHDVQGSMARIGAILPIAEWEDAACCMYPATLLHSADSNSNGWRERWNLHPNVCQKQLTCTSVSFPGDETWTSKENVLSTPQLSLPGF